MRVHWNEWSDRTLTLHNNDMTGSAAATEVGSVIGNANGWSAYRVVPGEDDLMLVGYFTERFKAQNALLEAVEGEILDPWAPPGRPWRND